MNKHTAARSNCDILIRSCTDNDIPQIARLYYDTVHKINSRDYSSEQINAWAPRVYNDAFWKRRFDDYMVMVAEDNGQIAGFCELQYPGHIDCFYVHCNYQRQGIGKSLMTAIEEEAWRNDYRRLFSDVSVTAYDFFQQMGFRKVRKQERSYQGLKFKLYFMEKFIARS